MEGFTSFRQPVTIDFTDFDLFAITGPTGAGKTSIIDAMIYSLYGCTPRISKQSISELISQGAERLKVMFVFSSGKDEYRIARDTKWTGKSSVTNVRLEQKDGDEWIPLADRVGDADDQVEKVVGLDFKGFTKSVVLPQGQFDEFLKGRVDDRRKILSDLLQLDIYGRMMQRANEIAKDHKNKYDTLANLLARDYAKATRENLAELRTKLKELKPQIKPLDKKLSAIRGVMPFALQLRQNRRDLSETESALKKLGPERASLQKRLTNSQKAIDTTKKRIEALDAKIKATTYDSKLRDTLLDKLPKSERLTAVGSRVLELQSGQKKKSLRFAELQSLFKKARDAHETAVKEKSAAEKELAQAKNRVSANLKKNGSADAISGLIQLNLRRIKDEQRKAKIEKEVDRLIKDQNTRKERVAKLKEDSEKAEKQLLAARDDHDSLVQQHAAEELKSTLAEGKPCPVCEQEVNRVPGAKRHPSIEQAKKKVKDFEKQLTELVKTISTLQGELTQTEPQVVEKKQEVIETETRIRDAGKPILMVLGNVGAGTEEQLVELREHILSLQEKVEQSAIRVDKCREKESEAKDEGARCGKELSIIESQLAGDTEQLADLLSEVKTLKKELGKYSDLSVINAELKGQNKAKEEFEEQRQSREIENDLLSKAKDEFAQYSNSQHALTVRESTLKDSCAKLSDAIAENGKALISEFADLKIDASGPDRDAAAQLERKSLEAESRRQSTQTEILRVEEQVNTLKDKIGRATEMRNEMEVHKSQYAVARDLALALRGDQFIAFIQEEAYRRLALDGSVHLESLSSDRYSFDFDKDEFVVVDHWNADEPRPVATLSGGETFLASLALALALAEGLSGLSHGRSRFALESLFLDEGFGSLDPDTLDVVMQGIETLGTSDRLVGIVSHIPELAERLPGRISVRKAVGGSSIDIS
jgi:exonuclease SbcC